MSNSLKTQGYQGNQGQYQWIEVPLLLQRLCYWSHNPKQEASGCNPNISNAFFFLQCSCCHAQFCSICIQKLYAFATPDTHKRTHYCKSSKNCNNGPYPQKLLASAAGFGSRNRQWNGMVHPRTIPLQPIEGFSGSRCSSYMWSTFPPNNQAVPGFAQWFNWHIWIWVNGQHCRWPSPLLPQLIYSHGNGWEVCFPSAIGSSLNMVEQTKNCNSWFQLSQHKTEKMKGKQVLSTICLHFLHITNFICYFYAAVNCRYLLIEKYVSLWS